jgi:hypothetical protein
MTLFSFLILSAGTRNFTSVYLNANIFFYYKSIAKGIAHGWFALISFHVYYKPIAEFWSNISRGFRILCTTEEIPY